MSKHMFRLAQPSRRNVLQMMMAAALTTSMTASASSVLAANQVFKIGGLPIVNFASVYRLRAISSQFGFDIDFISFPSGTERLNAVAAGYVDGAGTGVTQPILLRSKGVPIKVACGLSRKGKGLMAGSGINTVNDLRGKDIGTVPGSGPDIFLRQKLIEEGLNPDSDVKLVNMDFLQMSAAVLSGRVAAASGNEPQISSFVSKGGKVLSYLNDTKLGDIDGVMVFPEAFIKKDRGLAKAVVAALAQASKELQGNPDLVVEVMADVAKVDGEIIRRSLDNLTFDVNCDGDALSHLASAMQKLSIIEKEPALDEYLDKSLLEEI
jgi:NitT/TauT family transport system substrate-binding protein